MKALGLATEALAEIRVVLHLRGRAPSPTFQYRRSTNSQRRSSLTSLEIGAAQIRDAGSILSDQSQVIASRPATPRLVLLRRISTPRFRNAFWLRLRYCTEDPFCLKGI